MKIRAKLPPLSVHPTNYKKCFNGTTKLNLKVNTTIVDMAQKIELKWTQKIPEIVLDIVRSHNSSKS